MNQYQNLKFEDIIYNSASYLNLLNTYSDHINLDRITKARFFDAIAELINTKSNGQITKGYLTTLYVAHLLSSYLNPEIAIASPITNIDFP
ncbi:MAG: hypothetical protein V7K42_06375 [Nostoc sp.]